ncbi:MAG TPA: hypothetical protein VL981_11105 [Candidatus Methylacidiphilales bacterium]|nr:hypothetical protein [Candidatus Methylacidiphilales bacterium]
MALGTLILPLDTGAYASPNTAILNGITDPSLDTSFGLVEGDQLSLILYPRVKSPTAGAATTTQRLPLGCSIIVTGKPLSSPGASTVLFQATGFTESQDANSNWIYTGYLDLDTNELAAAIPGNTLSIPVLLVIDIISAGGEPQRYLAVVTVYNETYTGSERAPTPATSGFLSQAQSDARYLRNISGTQTIPQGATSVAVTGQTWPETPSAVIAVVVKDGAAADNIFATVDRSSISATGFAAYLSGAPGDGTHQLFWLAFPNAASQALAASQSPTITGNAVTIDLSQAPLCLLNFSGATGTVTMTLENASVGQLYLFEITQGATMRGATFPGNTKQQGGGGATYTPSGANAIDLIEMIYDGTNYLINRLAAYA